jgi:hypothetical protein
MSKELKKRWTSKWHGNKNKRKKQKGNKMLKKAKKIEVQEVEAAGLLSLLGERVLLMCANYFYEGILEGVDEEDALLADAGIVYETGKWSEKNWADRQSLPNEHFVRLQSIESYCISPSVVI